MTAILWHIHTGAGPLSSFTGTEAECMAYVADHVPLLRRRGYSHRWDTATGTGWRVLEVLNSRGRVVHRCGIRPGA